MPLVRHGVRKLEMPYKEGLFSLTITCAKWLHLIDKVNGYDIVYKWFDYLKSNGHYICVYVPKAFGMPNHIHVMIGFLNTGTSINTIIGNGKRFMAYEIVERLQVTNEVELLKTMQALVENDRKVKGKKHEVWLASFD